MSCTTISIDAPEELKDAIVGEFCRDGILGVWERPLSNSGSSELVLYFDSLNFPPLAEARIGRLFERNDHPRPRVRLGKEERKDWTLEWRKGYTSFTVGRRFQVVPSWETAPSDASRIAIRIDPGLAFGTGTHETTQLMLEWLEHGPHPHNGVLDLGTGSGILTIAAEKLNLRVILACDTDADAASVAKENFSRNGVRVPVAVASVDSVRSSSVQFLLANLTSESILGALGDVRRVLVPRGQALLSGILESQGATLRDALQVEGFRIVGEAQKGEWIAVKVVLDGC